MTRLMTRFFPRDLRGIITGILSLGILSGKKIVFLLGFTLFVAFFESFGIAMILPVLQFVEHQQAPEVLYESSRFWKYLVLVFSSAGIPINLGSLILSVLFLLLIRQVFVYSRQIYTSRAMAHGIYHLRSEGFRSFITADLSFFENFGVGNLVNTMTLESMMTKDAVGAFMRYVGAFFLFLAYLIFMLMLNAKMTLLAISILVAIGLIAHKLIAKSRVIGQEIARLNSLFSKVLVEKFGGVRRIKLSATENRETQRVDDLSLQLVNSHIHGDRLVARIDATVELLVATSILLILYTSLAVLNASLSTIGIFIFIMIRLLPIVQNFFKTRQALATYSGSLESAKKTIDEARNTNTICGGTRDFQRLKSEIRFQDVTFSYKKDGEPVLKDIDLTIKAGQMAAIVGKSGAGKTTLADLIPRLRAISRGEISFDGIPVGEYSLASLRRSIAFVSQDSFLFDDSILENIKYGCPDATGEDVKWAVLNAYLDPLIASLPQGLETRVGERAVKLSGGEKQRIILANALLNRASVIILDEPTSALDSESERYIQQALEKIRLQGNTTLIIIAHRLSTIRRADKIIVLEEGRVVEQGNHAELVHKDEWYADMVQLQSAAGPPAI